MFNEQRIKKNFIDGLADLCAKLNYKTEKELKTYLWKRKDFYRLDLITDEENTNKNFLKDFVLVN